MATKMDIFYREKAFHAGKQMRKNDFAHSEKFSSYAPVLRGGSMEPPPPWAPYWNMTK